MVLETEVKDALKAGENEIQVVFTSPYKEIERIKASHPDMDLERHLFQAKMRCGKQPACLAGTGARLWQIWAFTAPCL